VTSPYARGALAWGLALAAGWVLLAAVHYRARDPDSRLYAEISARMAEAPGAGWIAPEFPPGWYMSGLYREHPVGLFVPSAALAALEYPAEQAAYAMNALYQVLGIVLLQRLAATRAPGLEARALGWLIQLLPIAFTFRIRANQEAAVLLCLLAALYGAERASERKCFAVLTAAGLVGLLLVKGILAVFGPALCALWLISRRLAGEQQHGGDRAAWTGIAAGVAAMAAAAAVYEFLYRQATGEPFWSFYLTRQLGVAAATRDASGPISGFAYNLVWYLGRVLWFPFPWSVASALALWRAARSSSARVDVAARAGAVFTLAVVGLYVVLFSFSDRRADRYIFPVYFGVGAAGIVAALRGIPWLGRLAARLDRPWLPAAVWGVAFLAHLVAGRLGLATIKVWAP
jgi:hypothetical protein